VYNIEGGQGLPPEGRCHAVSRPPQMCCRECLGMPYSQSLLVHTCDGDAGGRDGPLLVCRQCLGCCQAGWCAGQLDLQQFANHEPGMRLHHFEWPQLQIQVERLPPHPHDRRGCNVTYCRLLRELGRHTLDCTAAGFESQVLTVRKCG
jgi:hypothetical protein